MLTNGDVEQRLRAVDAKAHEVAQHRRHYDASATSMSGLNADAANRTSASAHASSVKFADEINRNTTAGGMSAAAGLAPSGGGALGGAAIGCSRCQSMDVSLNVLRNNVASVEEGYLQQIEQLSETIDMLETERAQLMSQANVAMHETELQHSAAFKRAGEVSTLQREVSRLEMENETLKRHGHMANNQLQAIQRYASERDWLHLMQEEATFRSELTLMERTWWEVTQASWHAERLADRRVEQFAAQYQLRQRLGGTLSPASPLGSGGRVTGTGAAAQAQQHQFESATELALSLSTPFLGTDESAQMLKAQLEHIDTQLNEAIAAELRVRSELGHEKRRSETILVSMRDQKREYYEMAEEVDRARLESLCSSQLSAVWQKVGMAYQSSQDTFIETQKKMAQGKEKELSTLRKMLMESKEETYNIKKDLDQSKSAAEAAAKKATPPPPSSPLAATAAGTSGQAEMTESSSQTSIAEIDFIVQLRELLGSAGAAGLARGSGGGGGGPSTPVESGLRSPSQSSDQPSPMLDLQGQRGTPNKPPAAAGQSSRQTPHTPPPAGGGAVDESTLRAIHEQLSLISLQQSDAMSQFREVCKEVVESVLDTRGNVAVSGSSGSGGQKDTDRPKTPPSASPPTATTTAASSSSQSSKHEDLVQLKFTLRNLLVCVGQHQKNVHGAITEVSNTLTGLQTGMDRVEGTQTAVRAEIRQVDAHLTRAVERQMLIDRTVHTETPPRTGSQVNLLPSPSKEGSLSASGPQQSAVLAATVTGESSSAKPGGAVASMEPALLQAPVSTSASNVTSAAATAPSTSKASTHHWDEDEDEDDDDNDSPIIIPSHTTLRNHAQQHPHPHFGGGPQATSTGSMMGGGGGGGGARGGMAKGKTPFDDSSDSD